MAACWSAANASRCPSGMRAGDDSDSRRPHRSRSARMRRSAGRAFASSMPERSSSCPASSTRTSTSTIPAAPTGRASSTATRAAAAGGVTTLVDMPLNSIPATTSVAGLEAKRRAAAGRCHVDVALLGRRRARQPRRARAARARRACAASSASSARPASTSSSTSPSAICARRCRCSRRSDLPLLAHAELPAVLRTPARRSAPLRDVAREPAARQPSTPPSICWCGWPREFARPRAHRPPRGRRTRCPALRAARAAGVGVTVETCPHYLTFAAEEIADGATAFKCAPPIRERDHRERLWTGLAGGDIDLVATDHSPGAAGAEGAGRRRLRARLGRHRVAAARAGRGVDRRWRRGDLPLDRLPQWLAAAPARLAGLGGRKGAIAAGCDADLVVFDPDATVTVDAARALSSPSRHAV